MQPPSEVISRTFRAGRREGGGYGTQACLSGDTTSVKDCLYHKFVKQKQNPFCFFFCLNALNSSSAKLHDLNTKCKILNG